ncbi:MAG: JAB domain-containing protein [Alphaproteobacteria bacterium]
MASTKIAATLAVMPTLFTKRNLSPPNFFTMPLKKEIKNLPFYTVKKGQHSFQVDSAQILSSRDSAAIFRFYFNQFEEIEVVESFYALFLNRRNMPIGVSKISQGGICGTVVDMKIIAKIAVDCLASGVIICHNHPSGSWIPSKSDVEMTQKLDGALLLLDTKLLDHIILTADGYYSFADEGKM